MSWLNHSDFLLESALAVPSWSCGSLLEEGQVCYENWSRSTSLSGCSARVPVCWDSWAGRKCCQGQQEDQDCTQTHSTCSQEWWGAKQAAWQGHHCIWWCTAKHPCSPSAQKDWEEARVKHPHPNNTWWFSSPPNWNFMVPASLSPHWHFHKSYHVLLPSSLLFVCAPTKHFSSQAWEASSSSILERVSLWHSNSGKSLDNESAYAHIKFSPFPSSWLPEVVPQASLCKLKFIPTRTSQTSACLSSSEWQQILLLVKHFLIAPSTCTPYRRQTRLAWQFAKT